MRVFNLTESPLDFRGKTIPPDGGNIEYPELDVFVPSRDQALANSGIVSFGQTPDSWRAEKAKKSALEQAAGIDVVQRRILHNGLKDLPDVVFEAPAEEVKEEKSGKRSRR